MAISLTSILKTTISSALARPNYTRIDEYKVNTDDSSGVNSGKINNKLQRR